MNVNESEYTPSTEQVRDAYVRAIRNAFVGSTSEHAAEFDRWRDKDRAEAQVEVLRDAPVEFHQGNRHRANLEASLANAEATLYLAEQQRIANLIALASAPGESDWGMDLLAAEAAHALVRFVPHGPDDESPEIRPDIARALGIDSKGESNE